MNINICLQNMPYPNMQISISIVSWYLRSILYRWCLKLSFSTVGMCIITHEKRNLKKKSLASVPTPTQSKMCQSKHDTLLVLDKCDRTAGWQHSWCHCLGKIIVKRENRTCFLTHFSYNLCHVTFFWQHSALSTSGLFFWQRVFVPVLELRCKQ